MLGPAARRAIIPALAALLAGSVALVARRAAALPGGNQDQAEIERDVREADIAFYQQRADADPLGAADRAQLAGLYLQRGRESGTYADFVRAGEAARASLALRSNRNARAMLLLSSSLLAQHRFAEARAWAETLVASAPEPSHRALLGEIQLELGDYAAARRTFSTLVSEESNLAVAPRIARLRELDGQPAQAHAILVRAAALAERRSDLPLEQRAWFQLRVADIALRHGRLDEAARVIRHGLLMHPGDARLRAARLRLLAQRHDWRGAARLADELARDGADLATLSLGGDAHAALGRCERARQLWDLVEARNREQPEPFARQWTLFRLQHGVELSATRELLEREITERPDALGWQLLALARRLDGDPVGTKLAAGTAAEAAGGEGLVDQESGALDPGLEPLVAARDRCRPRP